MSVTLKYGIVPVTPLQQNCTVLVCTETNKAALVDPGGEVDRLKQILNELGVTLEKIFITHGHLDHASGANRLRRELGAPIEGPGQGDLFWIEGIPDQCKAYGLGEAGESFIPDRWLEGGEVLSFGNQQLEVLHCPGHTPGHVVFFHRAAQLAMVGDVLFQGSIGRTDFPQGDYDTLVDSIRQQLWPLGDEVAFIPGHGPMSTFGEERRSNPFVSDRRG